jgi:uncharacterized protein HemX
MQEALITIVTGFFASLVTWLFARRKSLAEAKSQEIDNYQKNADYYQKLVDDWVERYQKIVAELDRASEIIKTKDFQINELMDSINHLTEELKKYKQLNGKS